MKNTILFFDRCELTYLYGKITPYLNDLKVIHVAYSQKEVDILMSMDIKADYTYLDNFRYEYDHCSLDDQLLSAMDSDIICYSEGRFNLNSSIQSDRAFSILSYDECLKAAAGHYLTWNKIFKDHHVNLLIHEGCSLFFNHIASILCNKQGGTYSYQVQVEGDQEGFYYLNANNDYYEFKEVKDKFEYYLHHPEAIDKERCIHFLGKFRKDRTVFFGNIINMHRNDWILYIQSIKKEFVKLVKRKEEDKKYNLIDYWLLIQNGARTKISNIRAYKRHHILFHERIPKGEKYFFYPMHLEPESVVLYLGDGIYSNQIKLIENIAASLPPGYYLYVKDHPHEYAYRSAEDYERLMNVPNIRLISQWIPGKDLIMGCEGVVTISGTAGFEALLLGKQIYCFGKSFYSFCPRVNFVRNIRDLRESVYQNIGINYTDDDALYAYIMGFLESLHSGYINYFMGTAEKVGINQNENAKIIAKDLSDYVIYLEKCKRGK